MKSISTLLILLTFTSFSQNIISLCPDTVVVEYSQGNQVIPIPFVNNTDGINKIAVMETPIDEVSGVIDTVGFFSWLSPYPGHPETILVEPWDTINAFYHIDPALNQGYHTVNVCFWEYWTSSDTICKEMTIHITETLSTPTDDLEGISMYPNPVSDQLNISGEFKSFSVFDLSGKMVNSGTSTKIDMTELKNGVYIVELTLLNSNKIHRKVVKK